MLTQVEIDTVLDILDTQAGNYSAVVCEALRDKLLLAKRRMGEIAIATKLAKAESTLLENIDVEEAVEYSCRGEQLMLNAAGTAISEHAQARLVSITIGLTSAICRITGISRVVFCNNLVSNVLFAAMKAAYNEGAYTIASGDDVDECC